MSKKATVVRGRGRPRTNPKSIRLTLLPEVAARVAAWAEQKGISLHAACRELVELGLDAGPPIAVDQVPSKPPRKKAAAAPKKKTAS